MFIVRGSSIANLWHATKYIIWTVQKIQWKLSYFFAVSRKNEPEQKEENNLKIKSKEICEFNK